MHSSREEWYTFKLHHNDNTIVQTNAEFLNDYVDQTPLDGEVYASDASEVHTYIVISSQRIIPRRKTKYCLIWLKTILVDSIIMHPRVTMKEQELIQKH